ncbi:MAG: Plug domain-containing protein [Ignavibacteriales bacterium]|nr:Plug domain-containing protein [Ignavibacteriales bacterium]MCF8305248.1 Plug domain-containing protein [Ignavibacteriales bacterium]MCF8314839.1 Plug domain-containing protein [Ignavibacteriales bacterium]MCF8436212.1 Plug domain-containing protein [Ignavibacteriales bacterium]
MKKQVFFLILSFLAPGNFSAYFSLSDSTVTKQDSVQNQSKNVKSGESKADTLNPVFYKSPSFSSSGLFTKNDLRKTAFRGFEDIAATLPGVGIKNYFAFGTPSILTYRGLAGRDIGLVFNGMGNYDMISGIPGYYQFSPGLLDSMTLPGGHYSYIYTPSNYPAAILIDEFDRIPGRPITEINYFQGPDGEDAVDLSLGMFLSPRIIGKFQITNYSADGRFENSEYGQWNFRTAIQYFVNDKFSLKGSYLFSRANIKLNGGVYMDSLRKYLSEEDAEELMYDNLQAPVLFPEANGLSSRYMKTFRNEGGVKFIAELSEYFSSELNLYFSKGLQEFRQNERTAIPYFNVNIRDTKSASFGTSYRSRLKYSFFDFILAGGYEKNKLERGQYSFGDNLLFGGGAVSFELGGFQLGGSYKQLLKNKQGYPALGIIASYSLSRNIFLSFESSYIVRDNSFIESIYSVEQKSETHSAQVFEAGFVSSSIEMSATVFNRHRMNAPYAYFNENNSLISTELDGFSLISRNYHGIGFKTKIALKPVFAGIEFEHIPGTSDMFDHFSPRVTLRSSIYYRDSLFNGNLDLKTGLSFNYSGRTKYYFYDFENAFPVHFSKSADGSITALKSSPEGGGYSLDFFAFGEIQKDATIFFIAENITGNKYFLLPYYPGRGFSIRIGFFWTLFD